MRNWLCLSIFLLVLMLDSITCPPVTQKPGKKPDESDDSRDDDEGNLGLEYERYLKEVVSILESDDDFKKKLEDSNISDIKRYNELYEKYLKEVMSMLMTDISFVQRMMQSPDLIKESGEIARHLEFVSHGIRTKLDEIKRKEIDRLRQAMKIHNQMEKGMRNLPHPIALNPALLVQRGLRDLGGNPNINFPKINKDEVLGHLDHKNPNTFEIEDLAKLIKRATEDLETIDKKRKKEFKNYEMEKEMERQQRLKEMDEQKRQEEIARLDELKKKHADHPKLHHPGSKDQLEEVWEESDGMNKDDFDPKTFFFMHDTNGDGYLDENEVEALFMKELDKAYDPNKPEEDDPVERFEEMNRMREHVFKEVDKDQNKFISLQEFMESTKGEDFEKDEGWDTMDEEEDKVFTDEELEQYVREYEERQRQAYEQQGHRVPQDPSAIPPVHGQDNLQGQPQGRPQHMQQAPVDQMAQQRQPAQPPHPDSAQPVDAQQQQFDQQQQFQQQQFQQQQQQQFQQQQFQQQEQPEQAAAQQQIQEHGQPPQQQQQQNQPQQVPVEQQQVQEQAQPQQEQAQHQPEVQAQKDQAQQAQPQEGAQQPQVVPSQ